MQPVKDLYDDGKVAVIHGVGYPQPNRSHFRSMDIWHTAEPAKVGDKGWLGQAIRDMTPDGDNVVIAVNFAAALPRALVTLGAPVASVTDLDNYGLLNHIDAAPQRTQALAAFRDLYSRAIGNGLVMDYLSKTGLDALRGADILSSVPQQYASTVEYGDNPFARSAKGAAQVLLADVGTRICYTQHGSFDTHTNEVALQAKLWDDVAGGIRDLYADLKGARRQRRRADLRVLGVRPPGEGQRQRHRSRLRAAWHFSSATASRAGTTANIPPSTTTSWWRATWPSTSISAPCTRKSWRTGWKSKPSPSSTAPTKSSAA